MVYPKRDLRGKKFGHLTVIEPSQKRNSGNVTWLCHCDCGNTRLAHTCNLVRGRIKSCGRHCQSKKKEYRHNTKRRDLEGKKVGKLTVKYILPTRSDRGALKWLCHCDCGKETEIDGGFLRQGIIQSCGCLNKKQSASSYSSDDKREKRYEVMRRYM